MSGKDMDVSSFEWEQLKIPEKWFDAKFIKISERGEMIISSGLKRELLKNGQMLKITIELANELRLLKISQSENHGFKFPKTGRMKFLELMQRLEQKGYGLPAIYKIEWNENAGAWIGVLDEIEKAPKVVRKRKTIEKKNIRV